MAAGLTQRWLGQALSPQRAPSSVSGRCGPKWVSHLLYKQLIGSNLAMQLSLLFVYTVHCLHTPPRSLVCSLFIPPWTPLHHGGWNLLFPPPPQEHVLQISKETWNTWSPLRSGQRVTLPLVDDGGNLSRRHLPQWNPPPPKKSFSSPSGAFGYHPPEGMGLALVQGGLPWPMEVDGRGVTGQH